LGIVIFNTLCYLESPVSENTSAPKDMDSADMGLAGDMGVVSISWPGQIIWWAYPTDEQATCRYLLACYNFPGAKQEFQAGASDLHFFITITQVSRKNSQYGETCRWTRKESP